MVSRRKFEALALAFDDAVAGTHHGHPDFRAHGRIFASLQPGGKRGMVVLTPSQQRRWIHDNGALEPASGAWGRSGCTLLELAAVDANTARELLLDAWQNAAARGRKKRAKK